MLPPDLVRCRRKGDQLELIKFRAQDREQASEFVSAIVSLLSVLEGHTADEVDEALQSIPRSPREEKLFGGIRKLILDRADFGATSTISPLELRKTLFERAQAKRKAAPVGAGLERAEVMAQVAAELGQSVEALELALFSDLKGAERLLKAPQISVEELIARYELAQIQGVLLRAVSLKITLVDPSAEQSRALLHKLKFRNLLFRVLDSDPGKLEVLVDGPFSLFEQVTKYGQKLALLIPLLSEFPSARLEANLRWGKERKPLLFRAELVRSSPQLSVEEDLRPEVAALLEEAQRRGGDFSVKPVSEWLHVPGVGTIVADLVFERTGYRPVYLEVLGYWSRDAMFRRVEWAQKEQGHRVVFAASERLRVSETLLEEVDHASLYVFKGTISYRQILARVERLAIPL